MDLPESFGQLQVWLWTFGALFAAGTLILTGVKIGSYRAAKDREPSDLIYKVEAELKETISEMATQIGRLADVIEKFGIDSHETQMRTLDVLREVGSKK